MVMKMKMMKVEIVDRVDDMLFSWSSSFAEVGGLTLNTHRREAVHFSQSS